MKNAPAQTINTVILKSFGILSIFSSILIAFIIAKSYWDFKVATPDEKIVKLWQQDISSLKQSGSLPKEWQQIKEVKLIATSDKSKKWANKIKTPPIKTQTNGTHNLEVLLLDWEADGQKGFIVQYDLIESKSQNLIWELGRTFVLNESISTQNNDTQK